MGKTTFIAAGDAFVTRRLPQGGYEGFESIRRLMPWIVRLDFDGETFLGMEKFNIME